MSRTLHGCCVVCIYVGLDIFYMFIPLDIDNHCIVHLFRKEEVETLGNVMDLVARNMAIDITEGIRDKKEVASNVKVYR